MGKEKKEEKRAQAPTSIMSERERKPFKFIFCTELTQHLTTFSTPTPFLIPFIPGGSHYPQCISVSSFILPFQIGNNPFNPSCHRWLPANVSKITLMGLDVKPGPLQCLFSIPNMGQDRSLPTLDTAHSWANDNLPGPLWSSCHWTKGRVLI